MSCLAEVAGTGVSCTVTCPSASSCACLDLVDLNSVFKPIFPRAGNVDLAPGSFQTVLFGVDVALGMASQQ